MRELFDNRGKARGDMGESVGNCVKCAEIMGSVRKVCENRGKRAKSVGEFGGIVGCVREAGSVRKMCEKCGGIVRIVINLLGPRRTFAMPSRKHVGNVTKRFKCLPKTARNFPPNNFFCVETLFLKIKRIFLLYGFNWRRLIFI